AAVGALAIPYALGGFIVIAAAAFLAAERGAAGAALAVDAAPARSQEQLIDALIASMPDAAIVLGRDGRALGSNPPAGVIAPALARGAPASPALRGPEVVEAVREAVAADEPRSVEFPQRVPVDRWFMAHIRPVGEPPVTLLLLVFHDLTPLHRVEEMRADFVANASHELRTPLAALSGFIVTLQEPARDDALERNRILGIMKTHTSSR